MALLLALASMAPLALAQDPAEGWMAYAVGTIPSSATRITKLDMQWTVSNDPSSSRAFFSPWFGMDPDDNLNLIQPVNPWGGGQWSAYTEYFQWRPVHNSNSKQISVQAGQRLHGSLVYNHVLDGYTLTQTNLASGEKSEQFVRCQEGKKYRLPYVVYEKTFPCQDYPSDGVVTFDNITVECDGADCTQQVQWASKVKDANCNMKANILSPTSISITWDTSAPSRYDNLSATELFDLNYHGWATKLTHLKRP